MREQFVDFSYTKEMEPFPPTGTCTVSSRCADLVRVEEHRPYFDLGLDLVTLQTERERKRFKVEQLRMSPCQRSCTKSLTHKLSRRHVLEVEFSKVLELWSISYRGATAPPADPKCTCRYDLGVLFSTHPSEMRSIWEYIDTRYTSRKKIKSALPHDADSLLSLFPDYLPE